MTATAAARCLRQKNCRNANKRLSLATLSLSLLLLQGDSLSLSFFLSPPPTWMELAGCRTCVPALCRRALPPRMLPRPARFASALGGGCAHRFVMAEACLVRPGASRETRAAGAGCRARLRFWFCTCCGNLKKYVSADLPISHVSAAPNLPISQKDSYYHMFGQPECSRCQQSAVEDLRRSKGKTLKSIFVSISKFFFYIVFAWNPSNSPFLISHIHCLNLRLCGRKITEGV